MTNVLILEDDQTVANLYQLWMSNAGYKADVASSMARAVLRLQSNSTDRIDIMVLDLHLPNGKGIEVINKFTNKFPDLPLVVVTGMAIDSDTAIEAGAESVLYKGDMRDRDMVRAIREAIPRHRVRKYVGPLMAETKRLKEELADASKSLVKIKEDVEGSTLLITDTLETSKGGK